MPELTSTLNILVVEDDEDTRKWLARYLKDVGHVVATAPTMCDGLTKLAAPPFDVLLSDIGLPDGSGWALLTKVEDRKSLYPIAMSGFGFAEDRAKSKAAGYRHHLLKPFDPDKLLPMLNEAWDERQSGAKTKA